VTYDPETHHRRSIRLRGYDYALAGAYLVTIVTQDRACLLGEVVEGAMRLNDAGRMVRTVWDELPVFYPGVDIDAMVVMPNHIHGIIVLVGAAPRGRPDVGSDGRSDLGQARGPAPTITSAGDPAASLVDPVTSVGDVAKSLRGTARPLVDAAILLGEVVHRFKTMITKRYADGVKQLGWASFRGRLWQRNYYEHIIRDEPALDRIRRYIQENPLRWEFDAENPHRATS
jgi:putative transposase